MKPSAVIVFVVLFVSCRKDQDLSGITLGYDYFPNLSGSSIIYDVDSTFYGITPEEFHYQIKEELTDGFTDGENQPALHINRYYRQNAGDEWTLIDVWSQKRTTTTAERVEENIRFVNMKFPVRNGDSWNGNVYNTFGDWSYKYKNTGLPMNIGPMEFTKTVTVEQRNVINLVDEQVFYQVYAEGYGMIIRHATNISHQGDQDSGYDVHYSILSYSSE